MEGDGVDWLPDVFGWARVVAGLLAPGGFLYLLEGHPFGQIMDEDSGLRVALDYFDSGPEVTDWPYSYTDGPALAHPTNVQFHHGIGEVITSLADAGLRIEFLHEHDSCGFRRFESLQRQGDGSYRTLRGSPGSR